MVPGGGGAYVLVRDAFGGVAHELLHGLEVHFLVDLLEDGIPLLETKQDVLLDERELDARHLSRARA